MSVDPSKSMSDVWAQLEGHVINDVFPLRRFIGSTDHSGVFLTRPAKGAYSEVALKLVPSAPALAEVHLALWRTAAGLDHPHLLRLYESGQCKVRGRSYLYALMEYADQDLAQLLQRRALTEDETREMLVPALSALAFLHERKLVQGRLKPANVLVVGEQLKLASDTIRPVGEGTDELIALSVDDSSEAVDARGSTASDIWNLGVTICEALTRRRPSGLRDGVDAMVLPLDMPPAFREVVARCLSRRPEDRPKVADLEAWLQGKSLPPPPVAATPQRAPLPVLEPATPLPTSAKPVAPAPAVAETVRPKASGAAETARPKAPGVAETARPKASAPAAAKFPPAIEPVKRPVIRAEVSDDAPADQPPSRRAPALIVGAVVVAALVWFGIRMFRSNEAASPAPTAAVVPAPAAQSEAAPVVREQPATRPAPPASPTKSAPAAADISALHEVLPDISASARRSIRGTIRVSVRVIIEKDGSVFAALAENRGPSAYFERKAIEAAKKWTFPAADSEAKRIVLVRFNFTRDGVTSRLVTPR